MDNIKRIMGGSGDLEWTAPEFEEFAKGPGWYWISLILAVMIIGFSVWRGNLLFGVFAATAEIMIIFWAAKKPRRVHFHLTEMGLQIDSKFYPMEKFNAFAVQDSEIIFQRKAHLGIYLKIFSHSDDIEKAREFLSQILPSFDYEPSLMDNIARILRF